MCIIYLQRRTRFHVRISLRKTTGFPLEKAALSLDWGFLVADFEAWYVRIRNDSFFPSHLSRQGQLVLHFRKMVDHRTKTVFLACLRNAQRSRSCATDFVHSFDRLEHLLQWREAQVSGLSEAGFATLLRHPKTLEESVQGASARAS